MWQRFCVTDVVLVSNRVNKLTINIRICECFPKGKTTSNDCYTVLAIVFIMSVNFNDSVSFSDLIVLSKLRLDEIKNIEYLINEIYNNRHSLKSVGLDIRFKGKSITELYSLDCHNKNQ